VNNRDRDAARDFHEVTKHSYTSVRSDPHALDWENRPLPYKIYPAAGSIALPRELDLSPMPAIQAIAGGIDQSATAASSSISPDSSPNAADFSSKTHVSSHKTTDSTQNFAFSSDLAAENKLDQPLDLETFTRILFCADGLTRSKSIGGDAYHFRAAASAGALYPIEIYLAATGVAELTPGLYHFSPADLKLRGLRRGDWREYLAGAAARRPALAEARAILVLSAIFWRSAWKYRARAYRYCFWDAGTILANLMAAANAEGVPAEIVTAFEDAPIERLIDVDADREGVICLVALGRTPRPAESPADVAAIAPSTPPASLNLDRSPADEAAIAPSTPLAPLDLDTVPLSTRERTYDDLIKIHRASRLETIDQVRAVAQASLTSESATAPGEPASAATESAATQSPAATESTTANDSTLTSSESAPATPESAPAASESATVASESATVANESIVPALLPPADSLGLGETILRRGSTRLFARESISAEELATILATARAPLHVDFLPLVESYLIVNAVDGFEAGAYYYRRDSGTFELLKPGDFRGEAGYLCLEQPLGADCSALVCYMANLDRALETLGNRGYRDVHLEAGILGGRAYLAAYALGRGASGLTFYDDDTTQFFSPHAGGKSPLLMVAVGVPQSRSAIIDDPSS
jgi:SagB-type dehydrogenase family enzyme